MLTRCPSEKGAERGVRDLLALKARPWVGAWAWVEGEARAALLGSEQLQEGVWLPRWFAATPHPSPLRPGGVSIALGAGCGLRGEKSLGWADVQAQGLLNRLSWSQGQALLGQVPSPCPQQAS